ncbi:hypothetical protein F4778DRAFT_295052 [Xylariomycetidae sp. FL2044]|nr:hypothetical protein F4778DRAFT_295052 [Xylariomycetidae sp. FL2044]
MASNQATTSGVNPLAMMTKLSSLVSFYEPTSGEQQSRRTQASPKLIVMASWMDARDAHIAKYITRYQAIYPTSKILLAKFVQSQVLFTSIGRSVTRHALSYIRSQLDTGYLASSPASPEILVHIFSNGGATTMRDIYLEFQKSTGLPFPLHTAIYDSNPGIPSFLMAYNAFVVGLPKGFVRWFASPMIAALILTAMIWHGPLKFLGGEDSLTRNARIHNDRAVVRQTCRSYVYGKADSMVDWRHVERHAGAAKAKGFAVRQELFDGSPHVAHLRTDPERYWRIVIETWERGTK